jgi:ABC-type transport system substrate-binding protein
MSSCKEKILSLLVVLMLSGCVLPLHAQAIPDDIHHGLYIDHIVYEIITSEDQQILAIQNDEIDLIGQTFTPTYTSILDQADDINVVASPRNGYHIYNINTQKYPFNITAFRRALAFALDKEGICDEVWNGYATSQDSPLPLGNPFCAEGEIGYTYYEADHITGNRLLDEAGFIDIDDDGYREAPNGEDFDILIEVSQSRETHIEMGEAIEAAYHSLNIDALCWATDFYDYMNRIYMPFDYDSVLLSEDFDNMDIDWFAYEFWSEFVDDPYWNFPNWSNETFDYWRDRLLTSTTYENIYNAAFEMQKIWVHASPAVVICQSQFLSAYRTDRFEGFVNSVQDGVPGWWTNYRAHLKDEIGGPYGGTLRWSSSLDIDSFNFMTTESEYSKNVHMELYDSLLKQDPWGNDILWLAESYSAETHDDNPSVPENYTRFTFDIRQNATWTDNTPLTAEDVAFSLNYYRDAPENPLGFGLSEMTAAYAPTPYRVIIEFSSESYWHLHSTSYKPIIPKHIFQDIGLDGWNLWNPDPPSEEMVTSGPYNVSEYEPGEYIELTVNSNYFFTSWSPIETRPVQAATTTDGNPTAPGAQSFDIPAISFLDFVITIPSLIVIGVVVYKWKRARSEDIW